MSKFVESGMSTIITSSDDDNADPFDLPIRSSSSFETKKSVSGSLIPRSLSAPISPLAIVMDLEGILIHTNEDENEICDFSIYLDGEEVYIQKRPFVDQFLMDVSAIAMIVILTSKPKEFVEQVLANLDPMAKMIKKVIYSNTRDGQDQENNISSIPARPERIVILDTSNNKLKAPENTLVVNEFIGSGNDRDLLFVNKVIESIKPMSDVRTQLGKGFASLFPSLSV